MSEFLFAYGFLKSRFHGNEKTQTPDIIADFFSEGYYPGKIYRVNVYPGVIHDPDSGLKVKGEIFRMENPEEMLRVLDRYENALPLSRLDPDYERRLRPVESKHGFVDCWVYEYLRPVNESFRIADGEF